MRTLRVCEGVCDGAHAADHTNIAFELLCVGVRVRVMGDVLEQEFSQVSSVLPAV